jgi:hypothetical protein
MSESMEFPHAEYVDVAIDLKTCLEDELRMYPTEAELQLCMTGLNRLYEDTPFELMIADFAQVAAEDYADLTGESTRAAKWEKMFYVGGVLGLHLATANLPGGLASEIHEMYDADIYAIMHDRTDDSRGDVLHILGELEQLHDAEFDPGDTEVIETAAYLFDTDSDESQRYFFALGFRFAVSEMASLSKECEAYDYLIENYEEV